MTTNKNIKVSFFKSSENIQKKECGPDCTVSNNKFTSVTLNELEMYTVISSFKNAVNLKTDIYPNVVRIAKNFSEYMGLNL